MVLKEVFPGHDDFRIANSGRTKFGTTTKDDTIWLMESATLRAGKLKLCFVADDVELCLVQACNLTGTTDTIWWTYKFTAEIVMLPWTNVVCSATFSASKVCGLIHKPYVIRD